MNKLKYVYDPVEDCWSAVWGDEILVSISRDKVYQEKVDRYDGLVNEYQVFREMFGEIIVHLIEHEENEFFVGACLTKLFDSVI